MLKVGFAKTNINPTLGIGMRGYYIPRYAKGFLDDLEVRALAITDDTKTVIFMEADLCAVDNDIVAECKTAICEKTGVAEENIFLGATHTHTGPLMSNEGVRFDVDEAQLSEYRSFLISRIIDAAVLSLADIKPAKMGFAVGYLPEYDGVPEKRKEYLESAMQLVYTRKAYPFFMHGDIPSLRGVGYRRYFPATSEGAVYTVPFEGKTYIYMDFFKETTLSYILSGEVVPVEKSDAITFEVKDGTLFATGEKGYAVFVMK